VNTRREFITPLGGATTAWPLAARAQQPLVEFMSSRAPGDSVHVVAAFRRGLGERGMIEGRNVLVEFRWAHGDYARLPTGGRAREPTGERARRRRWSSCGLRCEGRDRSIPILFVSTDPVKSGLVASLNRPGGNATGVHLLTTDLEAKRFGLVHELFPGTALFGALLDPKYPAVAQQAQELATPRDQSADFGALVRERADALLIGTDTFLSSRRVQLVSLANRHAIPAAFTHRDFTEIGGLMSYASNITDAWRQAGAYAGRILKGTKLAELPVAQSTKFELVINHQTARMLGLSVPDKLLATADEVIE
jgi:putative ABC transport system substrate-binding protein